MKKTALLLMIAAVISAFLGFAKEIVLSYFYGASNVSDAYLVSITIPSVIFAFVGTGIVTGYIPIYSSIETNYGTRKGDMYTNNLLNVLMVVCTIIVISLFFCVNPIVKIFALGFEGETLALAIKFTKIALLGIYFTGVTYIFSGYLQLKGNYLIPGLIRCPMYFLVILSIILSYKTSDIVLIVGTVIATASQIVLLIPFAYKKGYKYIPIINLKDEHIIKMAKIGVPVIIGVSIYQINVLVDRTMASQIVIGGISALNYSNKINGLVQGLFVTSVSTALYPMISKMAAEKNIIGLKKAISEALTSINLLVLPATIGSMIFAEPIVKMLFGRGAFDDKAIYLTSYALFFYSIGMIGFGLKEVLAKTFYSLQDTKTPMINAAVALVLNIVLNIMLSRFMGIGGLALATSISAIFCTSLMFISLRKKIGPFGMKQISISFLKILFASLGMGLFAKLSFNYLTANIFSQNISLIISIAIGAAIYFTTIYFMKIEDVDVIVNALKRKVIRKAAA